jgi:protein-tyrosine-phosphatase
VLREVIVEQQRPRVLFLCTGNSARSQMAEAILRHVAHGEIEVASAGSAPVAAVHPAALRALAKLGIEGETLYPKPWDQFLGEAFDYVITVCDHAADRCPVFPGAAKRIHWSYEDPAGIAAGPDQQRAFDGVAADLMNRIRVFVSLPEISGRSRG